MIKKFSEYNLNEDKLNYKIDYAVSTNTKNIPVYMNPTEKDFKEIKETYKTLDGIRCVITEKGDMFIVPPKAYHIELVQYLQTYGMMNTNFDFTAESGLTNPVNQDELHKIALLTLTDSPYNTDLSKDQFEFFGADTYEKLYLDYMSSIIKLTQLFKSKYKTKYGIDFPYPIQYHQVETSLEDAINHGIQSKKVIEYNKRKEAEKSKTQPQPEGEVIESLKFIKSFKKF